MIKASALYRSGAELVLQLATMINQRFKVCSKSAEIGL
jgi:hypothetical protein